MRTRTRYVPLVEAEAGMVLAEGVRVATHGILRYSLPAGHALTADNLHQLTAHQAEFIFISESDLRPDEQVAIDCAAAARRTMEIFARADLSDPVVAMLFDQVLLHKSL